MRALARVGERFDPNSSRFWNVCLRHKLIQSNAPPCLQHRFILDNLGLLIGVLAEIQPADFGVGLDYGAKLSDMAMTAISILEMARTSAADSPELNLGRDMASLRSDMSSWVYKIIGLLSAVGCMVVKADASARKNTKICSRR